MRKCVRPAIMYYKPSPTPILPVSCKPIGRRYYWWLPQHTIHPWYYHIVCDNKTITGLSHFLNWVGNSHAFYIFYWFPTYDYVCMSCHEHNHSNNQINIVLSVLIDEIQAFKFYGYFGTKYRQFIFWNVLFITNF